MCEGRGEWLNVNLRLRTLPAVPEDRGDASHWLGWVSYADGMSRPQRPRGIDEPEPVEVVADYRNSPFGPGCLATITAPDVALRTVRGDDVHDALHRVMEAIEELAHEQQRPLLTMHTIDGNPIAFSELAKRHGFVNCLGSGP